MTLIEYFILLVRVLKIKWDNIVHHLAQDSRGNAGSTLLIFLYTVWFMSYCLQGCFVHIVRIFRVCFIIFCAVVTIFSFCKTAEAVRIFTSYLYVQEAGGFLQRSTFDIPGYTLILEGYPTDRFPVFYKNLRTWRHVLKLLSNAH